jgi:hypothetical protein
MVDYVEPIPSYKIGSHLNTKDTSLDLTTDEEAKAADCLSILRDTHDKFLCRLEESGLGFIPADEGYEIVGSRFIADYRRRAFRDLDDDMLIYFLRNRKCPLFVTTAELKKIAAERGIKY